VVDSSRIPGTVAEVTGTLLALREAASDAFLISDFSWRRGRVLREQTARAFDPPETRPLLDALRSVQLWGGSKMEAWLYFQWLASRLGRDLATDHAGEGPLQEGFKVTFRMEGAADIEIGCTRGGCLSRGEEKGAFRFPTEGEILMDEMDTMVRDAIFAEVLARGRR